MPPAASPPPVSMPGRAHEAVAKSGEATRRHGGLFGSKKRIEELESENAVLLEMVQMLKGMDALELSARITELRSQADDLKREADEKRRRLVDLQLQIVKTEEVALLQEAGVYEYQHPLSDAIAYKARLAQLKDTVKTMTRAGSAVSATTNWTVNGSTAEGRRMVRDFSKLLLRAYNAEADNLVRTMRPYKLASAIERLSKTADTIARLGKTMDIRISAPYHQERARELELTADYLAKVEEEKERVRAERERQREEDKARKEFEREKARLIKEQTHYQTALAKLEDRQDETAAAAMRAKLEQISTAITGVEERAANIRAGYVYVISNIGAFGERMVKIGMTRRLDPMDRVRELGDASVPFRFDVHALIFSEDAVGLEARLHNDFADRRVNRVNLRREFFYATPAEVRQLLERLTDQHILEYHENPEAMEWRASKDAASENGPATEMLPA
ncbi:DUF4041 domain-containing protein [Actinomadura sp. DC4]|uniref:DUF4041 domain-containing protein n=1 Tax=Actinomadura sp. DC4 TaxID=3055069 RepID=UPI0025B0E7C8|nr:DUF4041 domain-containing protein [Actinomadura sp. DC4]MDN3353184.1 DUF4041 domain-containing protein [Actinomadura sp. DC4]